MLSHSPVFAVGDIHGCAFELKQLIKKLPLDKNSTLVFLGDYIDRGPDSKEVIETILKLRQQYRVYTLMGNHEAMLLEFLADPSSAMAGFFVLNGGSATLASYVTEGSQYEIPQTHLDFYKNLHLLYESDEHFFVHAGIPNIPIAQINPDEHFESLLWMRQPFLSSTYVWGKTVVHGHTPRQQVTISANRINMDTGCVYGGYLSAMEVYSRTLYQVAARKEIPKVFLKEDPQYSRVAKRFVGSIPVHIDIQGQIREFATLNYNEFGLLLLDPSSKDIQFQVGEIIEGVITAALHKTIAFEGEVVRHQTRLDQITYGVRILSSESK